MQESDKRPAGRAVPAGAVPDLPAEGTIDAPRVRAILKRYWGYDGFRPLQEEIALHVCAGGDALALLPTGGGKSVCFQVPGLALPGICIVISPLIALMKDQVAHLQRQGIAAAAIYTGLSADEIEHSLDKAVRGELKFLYVSAERLQNRLFLARFRQMKVGLIAVDEAHCVSQWGYDFRPPYLQIADLRAYVPRTPLLALTATATPDVVTDIQDKLQICPRKVFRKSFVRSNLTYYAAEEEDKLGRLHRALRKVGGCGIVYVRNRRKTVEVAEWLCRNGIPAAAYHAGLPPEVKDARQEAWMADRVRVIVATNAFGMGIDKPDVRLVVHLDLPDTIEAYFQEAGRAGRDGKPATALLLYHASDRSEAEARYARAYPPVKFIRQVYEALCNYAGLPVGSGEGVEKPFMLAEFASVYRLPVAETASALGFLEREGYVCFPDPLKAASRVYVTAEPATLYRYEVCHPASAPVLKALLRLYGGRLFSDYGAISEKAIARKLETTEAEIVRQLQVLQAGDCIAYQPLPKTPTVLFLRARVDPGRYFLSSDVYKKRKETAWRKLQAMLDYAAGGRLCRSRYLVAYFGEESDADCGRCDACLRRKRGGLSDAAYEAMYRQAQPLLSREAMDARELCDRFPDWDEEEVCLFWRYLLEMGFLVPDASRGEGYFRLK
ncbi:MAG: RecQ family ATP-dependent DNA helicase [Bacteroidales bacterium]|nr:RecQ family ATP-dependent DNA helicase [Bacteroidales bacterium]